MGRLSEPIVAVFDCMVFLQGAARRENPAGVCLALAERCIVDLHVSPEILAEVADVLGRPRVRSRFPSLTDQLISELVGAIRAMSTLVVDVPREFLLDRDPKDEPYLNLAVSCGAEYLVSRDSHLLDLANRGDTVGTAIRRRRPDLRIVDPVTFLRAVRSRQAQSP